jgi:hypothetical protein
MNYIDTSIIGSRFGSGFERTSALEMLAGSVNENGKKTEMAARWR